MINKRIKEQKIKILFASAKGGSALLSESKTTEAERRKRLGISDKQELKKYLVYPVNPV